MDTTNINSKPTFRMFAPETWGEVGKFRQFYESSYALERHVKRALGGVANHFEKAIKFRDLALRLAPNLEIDQQELNAKGYTSAPYSEEFSAIVEVVFTELYSSVDCARKVIYPIFRKVRHLPNSTRGLFQVVVEGKVGTGFPEEMKAAFIAVDWYDELRTIRDELTHSDVGRCRLDTSTKKISYTHSGLYVNNAPVEIDDVIEKLRFFIEGINNFLGRIFRYLNSTLKKEPIAVPCGIFEGRIYMRLVAIAEKIDFDSGTCLAHHYENFQCPFFRGCGAHRAALAQLST